jgi:hydroxypyruvate isomerase
MIKQSLAWWCYARGDMAPERLVRAAVDIGYDAVELVGQEHWPLVRDHGLAIASIGGHRSLSDGLNRRENHARIEGEIQANLKLAVDWGIPNLIVFSGNRAGLDDERGLENTAEGLWRLAPLAEQAGVTLVLEVLNSKVDHPDYQCDHTLWGVRAVEAVGSPRVKLLYDIYHMQIMEGDLIRTVQQYHPHFAHYHTAGNPGRRELDDTQEIHHPPIFRAIRDTSYGGYIGHEFIPIRDPIAGLREAFEMCRANTQA